MENILRRTTSTSTNISQNLYATLLNFGTFCIQRDVLNLASFQGIIIYMQKSTLFRAMFWVLFIVGALNAIAYKLYLFWTVIWFDMVMHFLGGLFVALFFFWALSLFKSALSYTEKLILGVVFTVLVGLVWEYFELIIGVTNLASVEYWADTGMDIVMDTLGAVCGSVYVHNLEKKNV